MLTLDAINTMIAPLGETAIDATDPDYTLHPLYESALRILNTTNRAVQSQGWWFNSYTTTLAPVAGAVALDASILTVTVLSDSHDYTIRDSALFDLTDNTATISRSLRALVRSLVPFESLPDTAATYIALKAAERFVKAYDGDRGKLADVKEDAKEAYIPFNSDHIRNSRVNLYHTASMGPTLANNWYTRYRQR